MAINTEMVGQTFGPFVRDYTFRDLELFALGCGAGYRRPRTASNT